MIETSRLRLRKWQRSDAADFAAMSADPEVMHDLGGPYTREQSDAKLDRYIAAFEKSGLSRWAIENRDGVFLGYAGVLHRPDHPIGPHHEVGWRLAREAWGHGYASEGAAAALKDAFARGGMTEILSYTAPDNLRSQAVMARLHLRRAPERDFTADYGQGDWQGLVWIAHPA